MTQMGLILGTAAYMSPEQAKGRPADKRSDVWSFGAVLHEMLSGQRTFKGDDIADTLAAVLRQDVDWTALPAATPASVRTLLARCLERDVRQRLRDIGEARIVLDQSGRAGHESPGRLATGCDPPAAVAPRDPVRRGRDSDRGDWRQSRRGSSHRRRRCRSLDSRSFCRRTDRSHHQASVARWRCRPTALRWSMWPRPGRSCISGRCHNWRRSRSPGRTSRKAWQSRRSHRTAARSSSLHASTGHSRGLP